MTEIDKLLRRLSRLVKEDFKRFEIKDPDSDGLINIEITKVSPEKIVFFYEQAKNGIKNKIKIRDDFEKRMKEELDKQNFNIKGEKDIKKRLKPHYERVKDKVKKEKPKENKQNYIG